MKEILATAKTKFDRFDINRNINIKLASNAIDDIILEPGKEFSFNEIVGERTKERGYKMSKSIDNKKIVQTIGGGICQVSSTLNMAVKKLGLDITEVHIHSIPISYAKREDEAAVSWGEKDYRFVNNTHGKIKIESKIDNLLSILTVNIYSV